LTPREESTDDERNLDPNVLFNKRVHDGKSLSSS